MSSTFEQVAYFNRQFGVTTGQETPNPSIFDENPGLITKCLNLIREEAKELEEGVLNKNLVEVADAIFDSVYVLMGMAARLGIDFNKGFTAVHNNNMTKLCKTEDEAQRTVQKYVDAYNAAQLLTPEERIKVQVFDSPKYRRAPDNIHWVVYNESCKKVLKSINWVDVDLSWVAAPQQA